MAKTIKHTDKNGALVADLLIKVIIDKSYSMHVVRDATIQGFNSYLGELKAGSAGKAGATLLSLLQFDLNNNETSIEVSFLNTPLDSVPSLTHETFSPRGSTPLFDAVGQVITQTEQEISNMKKKPNVLMVVMTDGENNCTHGFSAEQVSEMIKGHEKNDGWTIVYLGANQDAWQVGATLGVAAGNAMSYDTSKMTETFAGVARASSTYMARSASMRGMGASLSASNTSSFFDDAGLTQADFKEPEPKVKGSK